MRGRRAIATANPRVGREMGRCNTICAVAGVGAFSCYSNQRRESPHLLAGAAIERGARGRSYGAFQAIQATSSLGERIFEADLRDVSYLSRCLDDVLIDVLMCGQRRAVVLTGAHGYNLLMTKIFFENIVTIDDAETRRRRPGESATSATIIFREPHAGTGDRTKQRRAPGTACSLQPPATGPAGARRGGAAGARVRVRTPERRPRHRPTVTTLHRTRRVADRPPGASPASAHRPALH
jgi:hypothetical protein